MKSDIIKNLGDYGYQNYYQYLPSGSIWNKKDKCIVQEKNNKYVLYDNYNKKVYVSKKKLYRKVYNKEYCQDNIISLKGEIWKQYKYDDRYFVSSYGRIKSLCGYNAIILHQQDNGCGYMRVYINGYKQVSKIVADAFITPEEGKIYIHHKDKCRILNSINNLQRVDVLEHYLIHKEMRDNLCH